MANRRGFGTKENSHRISRSGKIVQEGDPRGEIRGEDTPGRKRKRSFSAKESNRVRGKWETPYCRRRRLGGLGGKSLIGENELERRVNQI